jgi:two-component system response regulator RegX3
MDNPLAFIVEDDEDASVIFANALQEAGFECEIIRSGDEALAWLVETVPAVVVLDLELPGVPGAEILRQIRADVRLAKTHVIIATAHPDLAAGLEEKADLVLFKPVSYIQLRDLAKRVGAV